LALQLRADAFTSQLNACRACWKRLLDCRRQNERSGRRQTCAHTHPPGRPDSRLQCICLLAVRDAYRRAERTCTCVMATRW